MQGHKGASSMKVCLLNDSFPPLIDGVSTTVVNYAQVLTNHGDDVVVATPSYPYTDYSHYPYRVLDYPSLNTSYFFAGYRTGNPRSRYALSELTDFYPDIIHTHCPFSSILMAKNLKKRVDAPMVLTYHTKIDIDIARAKAIKTKFLQKKVLDLIVHYMNRCDEVWTVSKGAVDNLRSIGYDGEVFIMSNGVDFPKGKLDPETVRKVTHEVSLPPGVPVFLFVGRLLAYKGLSLILDSLKILDAKGIDFRMVFIGEGLDEKALQKKTQKMELDKKVFFTGKINNRTELRAWNSRADLLLFPSTYDTNGIVVREAAACGLPSVLIKNSCAAEGVTDGKNGYIIDKSPHALAAKLEQLCSNMDGVHTAGINAMSDLYFSWDDAVKVARNRYDNLISNYRSHR